MEHKVAVAENGMVQVEEENMNDEMKEGLRIHVYYFYRYGDHQDLPRRRHSFPTQRSSVLRLKSEVYCTSCLVCILWTTTFDF